MHSYSFDLPLNQDTNVYKICIFTCIRMYVFTYIHVCLPDTQCRHAYICTYVQCTFVCVRASYGAFSSAVVAMRMCSVAVYTQSTNHRLFGPLAVFSGPLCQIR